MSNQRAGKTHSASPSDPRGAMAMKNFFKEAAELLREEGQEDAAFYFEQMQEHFVNGGDLPRDRSTISRALGL